MGNINVQAASVSLEELQAKLTDDFTVTQDKQGNLTIYSNIEEYKLNADEVSQLLLDVSKMEVHKKNTIYITDEQNKFVTKNAIKRIGNEGYSYSNHDTIQESYETELEAEGYLYQLEFANRYANMNHTFTIHGVQPKKKWVIKDNFGRFCDHQAIFISHSPKNEKQLVWKYWCYDLPSCSGGLFKYSTKESAQKRLEQLNKLNELAKFDFNFHIKELVEHSSIDAKHITFILPIKKGTKTITQKIYRQIIKEYEK